MKNIKANTIILGVLMLLLSSAIIGLIWQIVVYIRTDIFRQAMKRNNGKLAYESYIKGDREAFKKRLYDISEKLNIDPNWLMLVMYKESKIDPAARNPISDASGLIQFMPATAIGLGTSVQALRLMDSVAQLNFVYDYYKPFRGKINNAIDLYRATFYPYAMGKPGSYVIGSEKGAQRLKVIAEQNKVIDLNRDKMITNDEFAAYVLKGVTEYPKSWFA